jgi:hypothetical protein
MPFNRVPELRASRPLTAFYNNASASGNTYYTLLDITGSGTINTLVTSGSDTIRFTVDGVAYSNTFANGTIQANCRFNTSVKIEFGYFASASLYNLQTAVYYNLEV